MDIVKEAIAGTLESSDVLVKVLPSQDGSLTLHVQSEVIKQFGKQIRASVMQTLDALSVQAATVVVSDKGALGLCHQGARAGGGAAGRWGAGDRLERAVMKLRRSMLFVPGDAAGMVSTSFVFKPDTIMFDLEDAVAAQEKDSARILVYHALRHPSYRDIETAVRINELNNEYGLEGSGNVGAGRCGHRPAAEDRNARGYRTARPAHYPN